MASEQVPDKFKAWAAMDAKAGKELDVVPWEYEPKKWDERDVDIKVEASSICGSCIHTVTNGWGGTKYPCVVGHEIVGKVVRAGSKSGHKVGDRVGVGAQGGTRCGEECDECKAGHENYCDKGQVGTYQGSWPEDKGEGRHQQGGYGEYHRTRGHFAITLPDHVDSFDAAPMMCGGVTVYTPLARYEASKGKRVGIVGIGGLGHFAVMFSIAMGAETYALSHSDSKKQACVEQLGLKEENFIITSDPKKMAKDYKRFFDLLLVTNNQTDPPVAEYLSMCKARGTVCFVGLGEAPLPKLPPSTIILNGVQLTGSAIGSPKDIADMLELTDKHKIKSVVQKRPMSDIKAALKDMEAGKARFRIVLDAAQSGL